MDRDESNDRHSYQAGRNLARVNAYKRNNTCKVCGKKTGTSAEYCASEKCYNAAMKEFEGTLV